MEKIKIILKILFGIITAIKLIFKIFLLLTKPILAFLKWNARPLTTETIIYVKEKKLDSTFINNITNTALRIDNRIKAMSSTVEKLKLLYEEKSFGRMDKRVQCNFLDGRNDSRLESNAFGRPTISSSRNQRYYEAPERVRYMSNVRLASPTPFSPKSSGLVISQMSMGDVLLKDDQELTNDRYIKRTLDKPEMKAVNKALVYDSGSNIPNKEIKNSLQIAKKDRRKKLINSIECWKRKASRMANCSQSQQSNCDDPTSKETIRDVASLPRDSDIEKESECLKMDEEVSLASEDTTINSSTLPTFEVVEYKNYLQDLESSQPLENIANLLPTSQHDVVHEDHEEKQQEADLVQSVNEEVPPPNNFFSYSNSRKHFLKNVASSTIPTPPPPPPLTAVQQQLQYNPSQSKEGLLCCLKPLHWKPINLNNKVTTTTTTKNAWIDLKKIDIPLNAINLTHEKLMKLFSNPSPGNQGSIFRNKRNRTINSIKLSRSNSSKIEEIHNKNRIICKMSRSQSENSRQKVLPKLLSLKKAQNIGIFMVGKQMTSDLVRFSLLEFDEGVIPNDTLSLLMELYPSKDEIAGIREYARRNPNVNLDKPEKFIYELSIIPSFEERVQCLTIYQEHLEQIESLDKRLNCFQCVCCNLKQSEGIRWILALLLKIGNCMNRNTPRANTEAFDLEILVTLKHIKAHDQSCNLMSFLVKEYLNMYPQKSAEFLIVQRDLKSCNFDFAEITLEMEKLDLSIENCKSCSQHISKNDPEKLKQPILEKLNSFFDKSKIKMDDLKAKFHQSVKNYQELLDYFCTSQLCKPSQFFSIWIQFFSDFRDIYVTELGHDLKPSQRRHNNNRSNGISDESSFFNTTSSFQQ